ncbi:MAG: cytochrome c [Burkholderiaceae bacterium]|jgi:cytochrome c55X|nr:cytochrome c [Burkholderiaceae bacterium]
MPTLKSITFFVVALFASGTALAQGSDTPSPARQAELVRMVRQDCGSCHGLRLTGGLGPALTPSNLRQFPAESLAVTIYHGRSGTPMPSWKTLLSEAEAAWIAQQLRAGFPQEPPSAP